MVVFHESNVKEKGKRMKGKFRASIEFGSCG
jgi:hypothetical protein